MSYSIKKIELYVRETKPGRMLFSLGKQKQENKSQQGLLNPLGHIRLVLQDSDGNETFGCAGDRLSVRWLDKRPGRSLDLKRRELVQLLNDAKEIALSVGEFETPFEFWEKAHPQIMQRGRQMQQEDLTSSYASAQFERAVLDAFCRAHEKPIFEMVKTGQVGFEAASIHPELKGFPFEQSLPQRPLSQFWIRHTIGSSDPLTEADLNAANRANDGLPETLEEYVREDRIRYFKIKVSGNPDQDLQRLSAIWDVIVSAQAPVITLDANEAFDDLKTFEKFLVRFDRELTGMFQHVAYIEQPLRRQLTLDPTTKKSITRLAELKSLLIDESDGTTDSYRRALDIGYDGTSHKNCKGVFKSLANYALMMKRAETGRSTFLSAEDLQNLPVVPLQQDFTTLGILGIEHCERNGHHYNFGLSMLSEKDRANAIASHPDLYVGKEGEGFLNIQNGQVNCASLQCSGFGVANEPDWASMMDMNKWVKLRHPE
ncbi:hypothetical protein [Thalassoglobus sp.]|uniref:hypothetical protein n=1 Tax=Thalassoglobus sp. TaxID=2795869 RepID=UPI003AA9A917